MCTIVLRVTVSALSYRIDNFQLPMDGTRVPQFCSDIDVTGNATIIHCLSLPGCDMAQLTIPGNLCM